MIDLDTLLLRNQVALSTIMLIESDYERASERLKPLLKTIQKRLFDTDFNVNALWEEHGIHDKTAAARFHELDTTPNAYITEKRLDVAEKLVAGTRLPIRRISVLVGYAHETTFARAFRKRFDDSPDVYRRKVKSGEIQSYFDRRIAKGVRGELDPQDGENLVFELEVIKHQLRMRGYRVSDEESEERTEAEEEVVH